MPELPEAERARLTLESQLGKRIAAIDDGDTYVCRPHQPGEIASALVGHTFVGVRRRGKFMWLDTQDGSPLGLHLGMTGHIALQAPPQRRRPHRGSIALRFPPPTTAMDRGRACIPRTSRLAPTLLGVGSGARWLVRAVAPRRRIDGLIVR